jgi:Na+-translocating ferredoxin:NAD+ oxidoreductase subunit B
MALHHRPGVFDNNPVVRSLTQAEALDTLNRAARAGLVHTVSNNQDGLTYICNCCTCSCGILRGMADLGIANVVARSAFVNTVDEELCSGCELCVEYCQFDALAVQDGNAQIDILRCVGCGVCVTACPDQALGLVRRSEEDILPVPANTIEWGMLRAKERHLDLQDIL